MTRIGRRNLLFGGAACLSGLRTVKSDWARCSPRQPTSFELSANGCGRATGYAETNKIVTIGDRTYVAWLDSIDDRFIVLVRTLNHDTGHRSTSARPRTITADPL